VKTDREPRWCGWRFTEELDALKGKYDIFVADQDGIELAARPTELMLCLSRGASARTTILLPHEIEPCDECNHRGGGRAQRVRRRKSR
jgi:hypothetical protein